MGSKVYFLIKKLKKIKIKILQRKVTESVLEFLYRLLSGFDFLKSNE
jgi:hypothetical protein